MVFPAALGILSGGSQILGALGGFFDNSAADAAYAANKQRVAEIDAENQRRLFNQLQVNASFQNRKARVGANLDNIEVAGVEARARSKAAIDNALDEFVLKNRDRYAQMAQRLGTNQVTNSRIRALSGRGTAAGLSQLRAADLARYTEGIGINRRMQEARSQELSTVAAAPIQTNYITDYVPQRAPQKGFTDYLNLAAGITGGLSTGLDAFNKFQPKSPYSNTNKMDFSRSLKISGMPSFNSNLYEMDIPDLNYSRYI
tara:strand:+ start:4965 stop:5738 length:774 start_codon:yes stop_codon:yes gene_type:complete